jgi:peptide/nickel transport system ATP-binding protein
VGALLEARGLSKRYVTGPLFGSRHAIDAVRNVHLDVQRGEVLAIVGESGSGKSTLARLLLRLVEPSAGSVVLDGLDITRLRGRALRQARGRMQLIFQNPSASLNPRKTVAEAIARPMRLHGVSAEQARERVDVLLEAVAIDPRSQVRYPNAFSGGQQQRIAIARALATHPDVIVADEPVSSLDASIQAQIVALLERLLAERHLTLILIAHDMALVQYLSDRVVVLHDGEIVEQGPTGEVLRHPTHHYTRQLLAAAARRNVGLSTSTSALNRPTLERSKA